MCLCRLAFGCGMNFYVQAASYHIPDVVTQSATRLEQKREFVCSGRTLIVGAHPDVLLYVFRILACWLTSSNQAQLLTFLLILCDLF